MNCKKILLGSICCLSLLSAQAADTLITTLPACREMALSAGVSAKAKQEALLAAEYNRKAGFGGDVPDDQCQRRLYVEFQKPAFRV